MWVPKVHVVLPREQLSLEVFEGFGLVAPLGRGSCASFHLHLNFSFPDSLLDDLGSFHLGSCSGSFEASPLILVGDGSHSSSSHGVIWMGLTLIVISPTSIMVLTSVSWARGEW